LSEQSEPPVSTGVVPLELIRGLSGLEFLRAIADGGWPAAPISAVLGFRLVGVGHGLAVFAGGQAGDWPAPERSARVGATPPRRPSWTGQAWKCARSTSPS
jgi:hypothetical protein